MTEAPKLVVLKPESKASTKHVIEVLEDCLARAREGEILAVAVVEVRRGRAVASHWTQGDHYHLLHSGAQRLAHRLAADED